MDPLTLAVWAIRLAFLASLYLFLALVVRALLRDIRAASRDPAGALGRLVVIASASLPAAGSVFPLDAVTTLGRDLGSSVVLDDPFSAEYRRRTICNAALLFISIKDYVLWRLTGVLTADRSTASARRHGTFSPVEA